MGHAGGELADDLHFLCFDKLRLQVAVLRDILDHPDGEVGMAHRQKRTMFSPKGVPRSTLPSRGGVTLFYPVAFALHPGSIDGIVPGRSRNRPDG